MTLRDALDDYKRSAADGTAFPGERRSTSGLFSGRDGRLVHVGRDGQLRDFGYPLTGLAGLARSRLGVRRDGDVTWFDDCETRSQTYYGDTALVVTEHATDDGVVTRYDLTVGDAHLTRVVPGDGAEVIAFLGFTPDAQETRIGQLRHDAAVEVYHADERDFVASATGFADVRGEIPATFAELIDDEPIEFPRQVSGARHEEPRLSGDLVCRIPAADGTATVATLLTDRAETSRADALARVEDLLERHDSREALERAAEAQVGRLESTVPESQAIASDLRVLDLLAGRTGLRIAGPDFDPFYAYSGGYGYTWFRDDAEISGFLLEADRRFDLGLDDWHASVARTYCAVQREDGTWPHRVWPRDATLAPGWANGRIEADDGVDYQADQTASVVTFLATYLEEAEGDLASLIAETVERGLDGLDATLAPDGRPAPCQNAWEDTTGRFTHTAATFLEAYATVAHADLDAAVVERAEAQAARVYDGLDDLWVPERGVYALREREDGIIDDRVDSATFALAGAHLAYSRVGEVDDRRLDRIATHVRTAVDRLHRETDDVRGLVRYEGDDWRTDRQDDEKIWTVSTAWGARAAADVATLLADRDGDAGEFTALARDLLSLVLPDGPLCMPTGYLPEQVFDDGTPDSATPLGWPHGIRLATVAAMAERDLLRTAPADD